MDRLVYRTANKTKTSFLDSLTSAFQTFEPAGISVFSQSPPNPVLAGDTVTVLCNGTGSSLFWEVDNVPEPHFDGNIFRTNRFTDGAITTWSGTITVNATLAINNTLIECVVQGSSMKPDTQRLRIIIAG